MMEEQYDYSIDVGRYLETLIRQRWLILGAAFVSLATAVLAVFIMPKTYEARALVASVKSESTVSFGSAIQTLSEEALLASGSGAYRILDPEARLGSYVQLIKNPTIAQELLDEIGDQLPGERRDVSELIDMVSGGIASGSDTIEIVAASSNPQEAALIVNAWAAAYTNHINAIYSTGSSPESYAAIQQQTTEARAEYENAQSALVEFENTNRIAEINRQINELQGIIDSLSEARVVAASEVISNVNHAEIEVVSEFYNSIAQNQLLAIRRDQEGRQKLLDGYITALSGARSLVFNEHARDVLDGLSADYEELRLIERLLNDAQDMREQVHQGGAEAAASNALALTLLKAQAFASHGEATTGLILQTAPANQTPQGMLVDLDGLIATLENRRAQLENDIQVLSEALIQDQAFEYLDIPLDNPEGGLSQAVQERYRELWEQGELGPASLALLEGDTGLEEELASRVQNLLRLQVLGKMLSPSISDTGLDQELLNLDERMRNLKAQLIEEEGRKQTLDRSQELAWETYKELQTKEAELRVASQTQGSEVALAAPAAVPKQDTISGGRTVLLAGIVGLLLGIGAAYLIEFWWGYKDIEVRPVTLWDLLGMRDSSLGTE